MCISARKTQDNRNRPTRDDRKTTREWRLARCKEAKSRPGRLTCLSPRVQRRGSLQLARSAGQGQPGRRPLQGLRAEPANRGGENHAETCSRYRRGSLRSRYLIDAVTCSRRAEHCRRRRCNQPGRAGRMLPAWRNRLPLVSLLLRPGISLSPPARLPARLMLVPLRQACEAANLSRSPG
jgi:hypothetical protein